jgi:5'-nucleotidase / UDP-sugar diphosphatase
MRSLVLLAFLVTQSLFAATDVTLLHFSDYHSHALPFYSEGKRDQGGIARAVRYLRDEKSRGALVFSGGDMINRGSPAWSDKYRCADWMWWNGIVDAMAFGNHDADYGFDEYRRCGGTISFPVISANTEGFKPWRVFHRDGVTIGVFAVAGPDFKSLVKVPELTFTDPVAAARDAVKTLRESEKADVVVMIGHEHADDDYALARQVPGIDVIFGTHSHLKRELTKIPETSTWYISPYQYMTYISRVVLRVEDHRLAGVTGTLVPVNASMREDRAVAKQVASMQRAMERDPQYRDLFRVVGRVERPIDITDHEARDSALGDLVLDLMRSSTGADVALSTASSFRGGVPSGPVTLEDLRASLPYDNAIFVYSMKGSTLKQVIAYAATLAGTDSFAQVSGIRFRVADPESAKVAGAPIDPAKTYRVATTDYLGKVARGYRDFFAGLEAIDSGRKARDELRRYIEAQSPVSALADGRIEPAR